MKLSDLSLMALSNLWKTKLRTVLTTLGVIIGIGALVSMVSFGTGMQKNVTQAFKDNDLFTSIYVTPQQVDINAAMAGDIESMAGSLVKPAPLLSDSSVIKFKAIDGVDAAFPEIRFPVKIRLNGQETKTQAQGLPATMGKHKPFNNLPYGSFFSSDDEKGVILGQRVLRDLNLVIRDPEKKTQVSLEDSIKGLRSISTDSLIGTDVELITSVVDVQKIMRNPLAMLRSPGQTSLKESVTRLKVIGIRKPFSGFDEGRYNAGVTIPIRTARAIPRLGFSSIWDMLDQNRKGEGYGAVFVRVKNVNDVLPVKEEIEKMGFGTFTIMDQLKEIRQGFLIMDSMLGAVGIIALVVAALGITNTMVMSILERTREIGIMKAIGGSEKEIKGIFFIEAAIIGFLGGIFGLLLGWIVTRIANFTANVLMARQGVPHVDLFYIPVWLILGAIAFSVLVSLLAGLYPATRAARVDPVEALRHD